jgi:hypothetical protein
MPDWKLIAAGRGLEPAPQDWERILPVMDSMQAVLDRLTPTIPLLLEPIVTFRCEGEEQQR